MFGGVNHLSIDVKNRMLLPAKIRDILNVNQESKLVITLDSAKCLLIYPMNAWEITKNKIQNMPNASHPLVKSYQRLILGYAEVLDLDKAGRLLIPQALKQMVNLERDIVLVGMGNRIELWNESSWIAETNQALLAAPEDLAALIGDFSL